MGKSNKPVVNQEVGYLEKKNTGFVGVVQCAQMHHPEINMVPKNVQR